MSATREIISLQFGNFSNYVGTHIWNIQETSFVYDEHADPSEINHDVLFREGKNRKGHVTYTPRLVLVDLKGTLKHLPQFGDLYSDDSVLTLPSTSSSHNSVVDRHAGTKSQVNWDPTKIEVIESEPIAKPEFIKDLESSSSTKEENKQYNLATSVQSWTDYMYTRFHPRTVNVVQEFEYNALENPFDTFSNGEDIWKREHFEDELGNKIRAYIEECDNCQGFQMLFDCIDGFSGMSIKCLEHLADEYSKTVFAVPLIPPIALKSAASDGPMSDSIRLVNIAMSYAHLIENSSLFMPLSTMERGWRLIENTREFSNVKYEELNLYQSSAIIASYLDTMSIRYRLKDPQHSNFLSGFCSDLTNYNRTMAAGALSLPFKMDASADLIDCLDQFEGPLFTQLSPNTSIGTDRLVQCAVVRGIPPDRLKRPMQMAQKQMNMAAYRCNSVSEMFQLYFQCSNYASMAHVCSIKSGMPTKVPYPIEIFDSRLNSSGFISQNCVPGGNQSGISSVPVIATAQSSCELGNTLDSLHKTASRVKVAKLARFADTGLDKEVFEDAMNNLLNFKDNYDDNRFL